MPVRVTCPSCSAGLSIRDEFAGRAVKCPRCGGLIPPQPAVATVSEAEAVATVPPPPEPPPPPPAPEPVAPPVPEPPAATASEPEPVPPQPVAAPEPVAPAAVAAPATSNPFEALDEPEDDRPRRRRSRDEDDDDRPRRRRRDERDEDDRPRRRRDEDDEDDRPRRKRAPAKSNTPLILAGVAVLLLVCAGVGYGVYAMASKKEPEAAKGTTEKPAAPPAAAEKYEKVKIGDTRVQVEAALGKAARQATVADISKVFRAPADQKKVDDWTAKAKAKRVVLWRGEDESYVLVAFYPNTTAGQVQAKEWRPKGGDGAAAGELDDDEYLKKAPTGAPGPPGVPGGDGGEVSAERLVKEFRDNPAAARAKYNGKQLVVEGRLNNILAVGGGDGLAAFLDATPPTGTLDCTMKPDAVAGLFAASHDQLVKLRGRCVAGEDSAQLRDCAVVGLGPDESVQATAAQLAADYRTETGGDDKYKGKALTVSELQVERVEPTGDVFAVAAKAKGGRKILVKVDALMVKHFPALKPGAVVTAKGICDGVLEDVVVLSVAWIAP